MFIRYFGVLDTYHIRNFKAFASDCSPPYHQVGISRDPQYASNKGNVKVFLFCNCKEKLIQNVMGLYLCFKY